MESHLTCSLSQRASERGITLAGVVARPEIMENVTALNFSTFGGNPLWARSRSGYVQKR
ncbi:MAG: hypothetical protein Ct9H90mP5_11450 [Acidimicrobiaceae bacterium]|nr:MAG: hypothetical protein Ct9H90mP5_11450 [Acidimicrobiaceae bacterium]